MKKFLLAFFFSLFLPLTVQAVDAPAFSFTPAAPTVKAGETAKQLIHVQLTQKPVTDTTITITPPDGDKVTLGKTELKFTSTDYNQDKDAHNFGVTLTNKAKNGDKIAIKLSGTLNGKAISQDYAITVGSTTGTGTKPVEKITAEQLPGSELKVNELLPKLVRLFLTLITIAAFFSLLYSGLLYITAGGDTAKAETARKNIVWALTGIIIALLSYAAVNLVANWASLRTSNSNSTNNTATGDSATKSGNGTTDTGTGDTVSSSTTPPIYVTDDSRITELTEYRLDSATAALSVELRLLLESEPLSGLNLNVAITSAGDFPLTVSPTTIQFDDNNWAISQPFEVTYNGDGQSGQTAKVNFSVGSIVVHSIQFTIP